MSCLVQKAIGWVRRRRESSAYMMPDYREMGRYIPTSVH